MCFCQLTSQGHAEESCKSCCHAQQGAVAQPLALILQHVPAVIGCLCQLLSEHYTATHNTAAAEVCSRRLQSGVQLLYLPVMSPVLL